MFARTPLYFEGSAGQDGLHIFLPSNGPSAQRQRRFVRAPLASPVGGQGKRILFFAPGCRQWGFQAFQLPAYSLSDCKSSFVIFSWPASPVPFYQGETPKFRGSAASRDI